MTTYKGLKSDRFSSQGKIDGSKYKQVVDKCLENAGVDNYNKLNKEQKIDVNLKFSFLDVFSNKYEKLGYWDKPWGFEVKFATWKLARDAESTTAINELFHDVKGVKTIEVWNVIDKNPKYAKFAFDDAAKQDTVDQINKVLSEQFKSEYDKIVSGNHTEISDAQFFGQELVANVGSQSFSIGLEPV